MNGELVNLNLVSLYFPEPEYHEVQRSNFLDMIEEKLEENNIVKITGKSGMGKTILLRQFCEKNNALSIFISPLKSLTYDINFILNSLIRQIRFLTKNQITDELIKDDTQLKMIYFKEISNLKLFSQIKGTLYFVIDGLSHIPDESLFILEQLIEDFLPIGAQKIKFIFSVDEDVKTSIVSKIGDLGPQAFKIPVIGLSTDEVEKVFGNLSFELSDEVDHIRSHFKGKPSDILALRSMLQSKAENFNAAELIQQLPSDMFEYSWKTIDDEDEQLLKIMAILVFSKRDLTVPDIAEILNKDSKNISDSLSDNLFFYTKNKKIFSKSEIFTRQLEDKLEQFKKEVFGYLSNWIIKSENKNDFWLLPQYYEGAENYSELFSILDNPMYISEIVSSQSMSSLKMLVNSGLRVSNSTNSFSNVIKYSLENSLINDRSNSSKSLEIEALMALNEDEKALSIARNLPILEDRIQYMCFIARNKRENKGIIQPEILNEIRQLEEKLDYDNLGGKGIEIASELISVDPELAIKLVEKTFDFVDDENSFDKVMVALSLESLSNTQEDSYEMFEMIHERVSNEKIKDDFSALYHFSINSSPKMIISDLSEVESLSARINMLASWCEYNESSAHSLSIIKYAFSLLASSPEHKSNAGSYYQLSYQLLNQSEEISNGIIDLFESRLELLEESGPTLNYIRLVQNIIKASDPYNPSGTMDRIDSLYLYISDIEDLSLKLEAYSWLLDTLAGLENKPFYNKKSDIENLVEEDIKNILEEIVLNYGYQELLLKKSLKILVKVNYDLCLETISKVNTIINREKLYSILITGLVEAFDTFSAKEKTNTFTKILDLLDFFEYDKDYYDLGIGEIIQLAFEDKKNRIDFLSGKVFFELKDKVGEIREIRFKITCLCKLLTILPKIEELKAYKTQEMEENLIHLFDRVDIFPRKVEIGYEAVIILAKDNVKLSKIISEKILEEKAQYRFFESNDFWSYLLGIRLLIRSLKGLIYKEPENIEEYIVKIKSLIDYVESNGEKAVLLSNLLTSLGDKVPVTTQKGIKKEIISLISNIPKEDHRYKATVIKKCSPALFMHSRAFADEQLKILSIKEKDGVYSEVCYYYLTKTDMFEPFDISLKAQYTCDYEDLLVVLQIIDIIEDDSTKYSFIDKVLHVIKENKSTRLNSEMKEEIKTRINNTIENKFNSPFFIVHDGYKLLSQLESILTFEAFNQKKIEAILDKVDLITNTSDKIFCKTLIASRIKKPKYNKFRDDILNDCELMIDDLKSVSEKILRFEVMAEAVHGMKGTKEKKYITKAFDLIDYKEYSHRSSEQRLVDLAYQLDSEFANGLVSSIKVENSKEASDRMEKNISYLEMKNKVTNDKGKDKEKFANLNYKEAERLCKISWSCLGELNANTISTRKVESMGNYIQIASKLPLSKSYPIYSWIIENNNKRGNIDTRFKKELFEALYVSCNFSLLKEVEEKKELISIDEFYEENQRNSLLVKEGMREEALLFFTKRIEEIEPDTIIICDPFFGKDELNIIKEFQGELEEVSFKVFTSLKNIKENCETSDYSDEFSEHWKLNVSHENPPFIQFCVAGLKDDSSPIHDRFVMIGENGYQIGGSLNGLGKQKEMTITEIHNELYEEMMESLKHYFNSNMKYFKDNRLEVKINSFSL